MTDGVNNIGGALGQTQAARALYQSEGVREVQSRARYLEQAQSPQEQAGLKRLQRLLAQETAFDEGAPRGFYLNIRV